MANFGTLERIALGFPEVTIEPHFEKISFRIKKKIFATYDDRNQRVTVKLSEIDQNDLSSLSSSIYQVDSKWGKQGWTLVELGEISEELLSEVLRKAYREVAPKKLSGSVQKNGK